MVRLHGYRIAVAYAMANKGSDQPHDKGELMSNTITIIGGPYKSTCSDGRWTVRYRITYSQGGSCVSSRRFWKKADAITWMQNPKGIEK